MPLCTLQIKSQIAQWIERQTPEVEEQGSNPDEGSLMAGQIPS